MTSSRDYSLDYLKGVGCFLMMIAHLSLAHRRDPYAVLVSDIGSLGMLYFFAVAGVTAAIQLHKYDYVSLIMFFLSLGIVGYCYTAMMHPTLYLSFRLEVFQVIALGSIAVIAIKQYANMGVVGYFILGVLVYLIKYLFDRFLPQFDGGAVLLPHADYVPWINAHGLERINPGFPLLPWLSYFFAGYAAYYMNNRWNLIWAAVFFVLALIVYWLAPSEVLFYDKFDMTPGYFLISSGVLFASFYVGRQWFHGPPKKPDNILLFFGQNSLMVFYVHGFGLIAGFAIIKWLGNQYLAWLAVFVVTYWLLKLVVQIKPFDKFKSVNAWIVLTVMIFVTPLLCLYAGIFQIVVICLELIYGFIFIINFPHISQRLKKN